MKPKGAKATKKAIKKAKKILRKHLKKAIKKAKKAKKTNKQPTVWHAPKLKIPSLKSAKRAASAALKRLHSYGKKVTAAESQKVKQIRDNEGAQIISDARHWVQRFMKLQE